MPERFLPLRDIAKPGHFGAAPMMPGVVLSVVHPVSLVTVMARKGKAKSVREALGKMRGIQMMDAGADQWFVQGAAAADLKRKLGENASAVDQSHGRVMIKIDGPKSRAVLAKGTPVNLHANQFKIGRSAMTTMAHVGVHLTRMGENEFQLSMFRGFSESFWEFLTTSAAEYGYQVR